MVRPVFPKVAVLLATHNGSRFSWEQIRSLADNTTPFVLHWLDDKSTDNTSAVIRKCAKTMNIPLTEWNCETRLGVPRSFFHLLECVCADVYLFCDQDDIWQAGKLDATVEYLQDHLSCPTLAFTGMWTFDQERPGVLRRPIDFSSNGQMSRLVRNPRLFAFMPGCPGAKTQGFTRPLRDLFLLHKRTADAYAAFHDWWIYDIAAASGEITMLSDAPGVLHRFHGKNYCHEWLHSGRRWPYRTWYQNQLLRRMAARHAQGLLLAAEKLPPGERLEQMLRMAKLVASLERRQSAASALRLAQLGLTSAGSRTSMLVNCVTSNAWSKSEGGGRERAA